MLLLAAGILALALVAVGIADAVVRGLRLWRTTKRVGREAAPALEKISSASAQLDEQMQNAQASSERLRTATASLQRSRAQLEVHTDAVSGAIGQVRRTLWYVPGI